MIEDECEFCHEPLGNGRVVALVSPNDFTKLFCSEAHRENFSKKLPKS